MPEEGKTRVDASIRTATTDEIRTRIERVQQELLTIENEMQRPQESLHRVREMLDITSIAELAGLTAELERRIKDAQETADRAAKDRTEAMRELHEESERLAKLWDVYKAQERDLAATKERVGRVEAELTRKGSSVVALEEQLAARDRAIQDRDLDHQKLRSRITELEANAEELKNLDKMRDTVADLRSKYDTEKERLAKLYTVYEELEADRDHLLAEIEARDRWFNLHREALEKLGVAASRYPGSSVKEPAR
ncbi:MAG: hypothetical protein ACT4PT_07335 [Methanobacteriota archaeon]